jgi:hypothetical protein
MNSYVNFGCCELKFYKCFGTRIVSTYQTLLNVFKYTKVTYELM